MPRLETEKQHGPKSGRSMAYGNLPSPIHTLSNHWIAATAEGHGYLLFRNLKRHE